MVGEKLNLVEIKAFPSQTEARHKSGKASVVANLPLVSRERIAPLKLYFGRVNVGVRAFNRREAVVGSPSSIRKLKNALHPRFGNQQRREKFKRMEAGYQAHFLLGLRFRLPRAMTKRER